MPFLMAFFVLFSTMTFLFNLVNRKKSTLLEVLGLLVNAGTVFRHQQLPDPRHRLRLPLGRRREPGAGGLLRGPRLLFPGPETARPRAAAVVHGPVGRLSGGHDPALAVRREMARAVWAIQALAMVWLAGKLDSHFLRQLAFVLFHRVQGSPTT